MYDYKIVSGCKEKPMDKVDFFGGTPTYKKGVWKTLANNPDGTAFAYNQLEVDPYSCTLVATFGALSDFTKNKSGIVTKVMPYTEMKKALEKMAKDGKFRYGSGAYLEDGVRYAVNAFNSYFKTNIRQVKIQMNIVDIITGMEHSSVVTGVKANSDFFKDMQDNGTIDTPHQVGNIGHAMRIVKLNTLDDILFKFCNSYHGAMTKFGTIAKDIILLDLEQNSDVLFNTGFYFK